MAYAKKWVIYQYEIIKPDYKQMRKILYIFMDKI